MAITKLAQMINPEVMAEMISAKIEDAIVVTPFATIDRTLQGQPGDTITVPRYNYIGDAEDVAEAGNIPEAQLTTQAVQYTVKKAGKGVTLTDEAVLSGYGNPVGQTTYQLALSLASKVDADAIAVLQNGTYVSDDSSNKISYAGIVKAIDLFNEEMNTEKVIFVAPHQITTLRQDSNFISADKYPHEVIMKGEIGMIANTHVVQTRRVSTIDGTQGSRTITIAGTIAIGDKFSIDGMEFTATVATAKNVADGLVALITANTACQYSASNSNGVITLTEKTGFYGVGLVNVPALGKVSDAGTITASGTYSGTTVYCNPIVKLQADTRTEDDLPALTIYLKRDVLVESERDTHTKTTFISADEHYVVALTDATKVVVAKFLG